MVYDCFSFFNELDILEIRLNILKDIVDKFILVEATYTHTGTPKPLYYQDNAKRFAAFNDKIIHIVVNDKPIAPNDENARGIAWGLENHQRNAIIRGLSEARPDDVIIISDVDEIPNPLVLKKAIHSNGITRLGLRMYYFYFNYRNISIGAQWPGPQVATFKTFSDPTKCVASFNEYLRPYANKGPTASVLRFAKTDNFIKDAGWHFSYLGGIPMIQKKLAAIAHTEFNKTELTDPEHIKNCIRSGVDLFGRGDKFYVETLNASFPDYIREEQDRFSGFIMPTDQSRGINKIHKLKAEFKLAIQNFIIEKLPPAISNRLIHLKQKLIPGRFV